MKKKIIAIVLLATLGIMNISGCKSTEEEKKPDDSLTGTTIEIVKDTKFANGFGAAWNYGTAFTKNNVLKKGFCRDYADITDPYGVYDKIYIIPKGEIWKDAVPKDEDDIFWSFEEGYHNKFTDLNNRYIEELHAHKLCVNNRVVTNSENMLDFEQYNNYGLSKDDLNYNSKLVKKIATDKNGLIKTYYNTYNEIRNVAYKYDSDFAYDTWPHLYMQHNLKEDLPLDKFSKINVSLKIKVNSAEQINTWPQGESDVPGQNPVTGPRSQSAVGINSYFLLRYRADPIKTCMFVGQNLFATSSELRGEILTTEQYGNIFYREMVNGYSSTGKQPEIGGDFVTVEFDLIQLVKNCIEKLKESNFSIKNTVLSDWDLSFYQIGYENMGNWKSEYELKDLSVLGIHI